MNGKTVVSLFDESGNMLRPWAEAGYDCYAYDIVNWPSVEYVGAGKITYRGGDLFNDDVVQSVVDLNPCILFGFPPCTDLATSGSLHFDYKRSIDPDFQVKAVRLCRQVEKIGNLINCPWMLENPVSVLSSMWRKPNFIFNPYEYGGYLPDDDSHPRYPEYIRARDAYPKRTCIWCGNGFQKPHMKPVDVDRGYSDQYKKLGGKSRKTKKIRSETPRGFAKAVFVHHHGWKV